jgi:hypothetical protein
MPHRHAPAPAPDLATLLARACAALGPRWDEPATLHLEGRVAAGGLEGPWSQLVETSTGRSTTTLTLGPATISRGFDGARAWQRAPGGEVIAQDAEAARQAATTEAWLLARGWRMASAQLQLRPDDDGRHDVVDALPLGGAAVVLWFDRQTARLVRSVQNQAGTDVVKTYEDFHTVDGRVLPWRTASGSGDARRDIVVVLARVAAVAPAADEDFAPPAQCLDDAEFLAGGTRASVPFELVDRHVYLDAAIDGHPVRLMLDTGGTTLLTPEAAARAGLSVQGRLEARGPGAAAVDVGFARVGSLVVGGAVALARPLVRVVALPDFEDVEGTRFDGVLGAELFQRLAVEIAYADRVLHLADPRTWIPPDGASSLPLRFHAHLPAVEATLDGLRGEFWLDTGNRNALTLWSPFVAAHGLGARYGAGPETTIGWGVGGRSPGRVARGGRLELGTLTVEAPVLTLATQASGPTATRAVAGNIGGDLLRRFDVAFDYTHSRVYFRPNSDSARPFDHDCAGLWLNRSAGGIIVSDVTPGGAADAAGLRAGDLVLEVDGLDTRALDLDTLRQRMREGHVPTRMSLRIARGGDSFDLWLRLASPI